MEYVARASAWWKGKVVEPLNALLEARGVAFRLDPTVLAAALATLIVAVVIARLVSKFFFKPKRGKTVLILGHVDAGKTALFYYLTQGAFRDTHTSMKPNIARYVPTLNGRRGKEVRLVDFPGHRSQRLNVQNFFNDVRSIVFVVDSVVSTEIRAVAEYLYELLTNEDLINKNIPLLIACNKSDIMLAAKPAEVEVKLAQELERLRKSRASLADQSETMELQLGYEGQVFQFEHAAVPVSFCSCSVRAGNVDEVISFIAE